MNSESYDSPTPGTSIMLYIVGSIALGVGVLSLIAAGQDSRELAVADAQVGVEAIIGGFFFFGFSYVARKLQQIEAHLASIRKTEADLAARRG
jgi:hypothetical protein